MIRTLVLVVTVLILPPVPAVAEASFSEAVDGATPDHRIITDNSTRELLETFQPVAHVDPSSYRPMSFYEDYLPGSFLKHDTRGIVSRSPSRRTLSAIARAPGYYLDYRTSPHQLRGRQLPDQSPTYYGRVYADTVMVDSRPERLLFLKYSTVFPYSGLPWQINGLKWLGSQVVGNPYAWHELDVHGAVYVIVEPEQCAPLGVVLAQHNYHRTLWRSEDFKWPTSSHVKIAYATNSNEPYLLSPERRSRTVRTVGNPENLPWLFGRQSRPLMDAGYDRILAPEDGAVTVPMKLKIPPKHDPIYRANIPLGDRLKILYYWSHWTREGPPGIDYYAPPRLVDVADLTAFYDIEAEDETFWTTYKQSDRSLLDFPGDQLLNHQRKKVGRIIKKLKTPTSPSGDGCSAVMELL